MAGIRNAYDCGEAQTPKSFHGRCGLRNTAGMSAAAAGDYMTRTQDELGLPCIDAARIGVGAIVDRLAA
jgi:hypothetical protein